MHGGPLRPTRDGAIRPTQAARVSRANHNNELWGGWHSKKGAWVLIFAAIQAALITIHLLS